MKEAAWESAHCAELRTKGMYMPENPKVDRLTPGGSPTAAFYCLRTMKTIGPDDSLVTAKTCVPGRSCFVDPRYP
ncbi:MAG: hypothetical protein U0166_05490 [Acidobacteriota bacterium]